MSTGTAHSTGRSQGAAPAVASPAGHSRPPADSIHRTEERKVRRNMRREQLYSAIRQAMTRAGVLSASFKFKVLSLDQGGDQFLVMMDVHPSLGLEQGKMTESEAWVSQTAQLQFGIRVTSVYWRIDTKAEPGMSRHPAVDSTSAVDVVAPIVLSDMAPSNKKPPAARFEPIDDQEVAAFKRALAMSNLQPALPQHQFSEAHAKSRNGPHSYTLLTGFEDTEMPETAATPALSTTQYGDLQ